MKLGKENQDDLEGPLQGESRETQPLIIEKGCGNGAQDQLKVETKLLYSSPFAEWFFTRIGIDNLYQNFGYKLLIMLFASQHVMKGFASTFTGGAVQQYLYAAYKVPGPQMQIFNGVTQLPWAMKPVIGLISDVLPLGGYNKAPYILIASFFGVLACAAVGNVPQSHMGVERVVACLFLMQLQYSTCDLLTEAKYAESMQSKPQHGPALMTFVWFGLQFSGLIATAMVGPIITHFGAKVPYLISVFPALFIIIPVAKNYLEEVPKTATEVETSRAIMLEQKEACILCLLMFAGTIILTVVGIAYESATVNAACAVGVACVMLVAFSVMLRPIIAKVNAFFLIQTSLGISISGAAFYFYTDTEEMYPDGPHFSMQFMTSVMGVVGSLCSLLGILSYQKIASDWTYRRLLLSTNLIGSVLALSDVVMFTRFNKKVHIPDHAFMLGSSVLGTVVGQWMWMPGIVILSQLCPKGMEATMYALLAGCHNLGNTISSNLGAYVLERLGSVPTGQPHEQDQFKYLWVGSLLGTVLPLLTCALLPWFIPDARQTDKLLDENDRDATTGSLWRQWTGR